MEGLTQKLADFAVNMTYEDLPPEVSYECKRLLLDSIGCALAGLATEKGKLSVALAKRLGGPPESTIIGTQGKVSSASAAFANGELINALDYDALLAPVGHVSPFVIAAPLAMGELVRASGKDLIVAIALSHEIASRLAAGLVTGGRFTKEVPGKGITMGFPVQGYGLCIFGGVAGTGKILGLDRDKMCHALGISGYICPVPTLMKFAITVPSAMSKYLSAGWISKAEVITALLAEMGYTGDREVLDGEYGFWKSFASDGFIPEVVTRRLGEDWCLPYKLAYKAYPCCGVMQDALDYFRQIIEENSLEPDDIEQVKVSLNSLAELPLWQNRQIETHIEAQFSVAYAFAVAAHRISIGPEWQNPNTFTNEKVMEFMKKVSCDTYSDYSYLLSQPIVEVAVRKRGYGERKVYSKRANFSEVTNMGDDELIEKFIRNSSGILAQTDANKVVKEILRLGELQDISELLLRLT